MSFLWQIFLSLVVVNDFSVGISSRESQEGKLVTLLNHCAVLPFDSNDSTVVTGRTTVSLRMCPRPAASPTIRTGSKLIGVDSTDCNFKHSIRLAIEFPSTEKVTGLTIMALDENGIPTGRYPSCDGFDETVEVPCSIQEDGDFAGTYMAYQVYKDGKTKIPGQTQLIWQYYESRPKPKEILFYFTRIVDDGGKVTFISDSLGKVLGTTKKFSTETPEPFILVRSCNGVAFEELLESPAIDKSDKDRSNNDYFYYKSSRKNQLITFNRTFSKECSRIIKGSIPKGRLAQRPRIGLTIGDFYNNCESLTSKKGCLGEGKLRAPCIQTQNCDSFLSFEPAPDHNFRFEVLGKIPLGYGYVAMALSLDEKMGQDIVVECAVTETGQMSVYLGWNEFYGKYIRFQNTKCTMNTFGKISMCDIAVVNGYILCSFYQKTYLVAFGHKFQSDINETYLLMASGSKVTADIIGYHDMEKVASERLGLINVYGKKINFDFDYSVHGTLMIIVWMVLVPNAIFIARYFKESFTSLRIFGKGVWNPIHKTVNLLAFILTNIAFWQVLYVSYSQRLRMHQTSFQRKLHVRLGFAVCILMGFQVVAGFGYPTSRARRKFFAAMHYFVGNSCYICALVLIYSSYHLGVPCIVTSIVVLWVAWTLFWNGIMAYHFALIDRIVPFKRKKDHMNRAFIMWPMTAKLHTEAPFGKKRLKLLLYHFLGSIVLTTILLLWYWISNSKTCSCTGFICI